MNRRLALRAPASLETAMQPLEERDYFTDHSILRDPYAYFDAVRAKGPVHVNPQSGVVVVTGFKETVEVLNNDEDFSSLIATTGAGASLPFHPEGSDINGQIDANRDKIMGGDLVVTYDDQTHRFSRSLLSFLFTPSRLKANEAFIARYSEQLVRDAVARGGCDLVKEIATPYVTMVIADLLGVPEDDRQLFMDAIEEGPPPGSLNSDDIMEQNRPLVIMGMYFAQYVSDRRETPRDDILSELSNAKFPDGSSPDALEIVRMATFLFGAGQDTSAKLLGNAMCFIVDEPGLQDRLRADPSLISPFLEEVLRLEGSTKMTSRLARKDTRIGDVEIAAGSRVLVGLSAANRDPARWPNPNQMDIGRPRLREHVGFSRGPHVCIGAPLARAEVRVILERFLKETSHIDLVEEKHGPRGARTLEYEASFIIRGLAELHLKLTPAADFKAPAAPKPIVKAEKRGIFGFGKKKEAVEGGPISTGGAKIGDLLANPAAKAVIDNHFPGVSSDSRISMGKNMTLRAVQKFAPHMFTPEALDAADVDLAKLPVQ